MNDIIDALSAAVYSEAGIERAKQYVRSRGIDPATLRFPWTITDGNLEPFWQFQHEFPPKIFTDCLYIPIVSTYSAFRPILVGFDVRYVGKEEHRLRYHKFKRTPDTMLFYTTKPICDISPDSPILVIEGALDVESVRHIGIPAVSALTAMHNPKFMAFLYAISSNIYIMYDNDMDGRKATSKILEISSIDQSLTRAFHPIIYTGKDPNDVLMHQGKDYLKQIVETQIQ